MALGADCFWMPERYMEISRLRSMGLRWREIAEHMGRPGAQATMCANWRRWHRGLCAGRNGKLAQEHRELERLVYSGWTKARIARHLGVTPPAVFIRLKKLGYDGELMRAIHEDIRTGRIWPIVQGEDLEWFRGTGNQDRGTSTTKEPPRGDPAPLRCGDGSCGIRWTRRDVGPVRAGHRSPEAPLERCGVDPARVENGPRSVPYIGGAGCGRPRGRPIRDPRCGVFAIVHTPSGRAHIGASRNIGEWTKRLRNRLRCGKCGNTALQRVWNRDGPDAFAFQVLEGCHPDNLWDCKRRWKEAIPKLFSPTGERGETERLAA